MKNYFKVFVWTVCFLQILIGANLKAISLNELLNQIDNREFSDPLEDRSFRIMATKDLIHELYSINFDQKILLRIYRQLKYFNKLNLEPPANAALELLKKVFCSGIASVITETKSPGSYWSCDKQTIIEHKTRLNTERALILELLNSMLKGEPYGFIKFIEILLIGKVSKHLPTPATEIFEPSYLEMVKNILIVLLDEAFKSITISLENKIDLLEILSAQIIKLYLNEASPFNEISENINSFLFEICTYLKAKSGLQIIKNQEIKAQLFILDSILSLQKDSFYDKMASIFKDNLCCMCGGAIFIKQTIFESHPGYPFHSSCAKRIISECSSACQRPTLMDIFRESERDQTEIEILNRKEKNCPVCGELHFLGKISINNDPFNLHPSDLPVTRLPSI